MYKLYNADCLKIMEQLDSKSIDLILCDLPYGITPNSWDIVIPFEDLWKQYNRIIKDNGNIVLFSSGAFTIDLINSNRGNFRYRLIWKKNVPTGMSNASYRPMHYFEEICIFHSGNAVYNPIPKQREGVGKDCYNYNHYCGDNLMNYEKQPKRYDPNFVQPSDILEFDVVPNRNGKLHPSQKPVELLEYLINTYSNEGATVLDNTMGSGSTGVAAVKLNRDFIGVELDSNFFNIAQQRIEDVYNNKDLNIMNLL